MVGSRGKSDIAFSTAFVPFLPIAALLNSERISKLEQLHEYKCMYNWQVKLSFAARWKRIYFKQINTLRDKLWLSLPCSLNLAGLAEGAFLKPLFLDLSLPFTRITNWTALNSIYGDLQMSLDLKKGSKQRFQMWIKKSTEHHSRKHLKTEGFTVRIWYKNKVQK